MPARTLVAVLGIVGAGLLGIVVLGHRGPEPASLRVTASFYPLFYFAEQIAGTDAAVTNLTPAGAEPHDYEPTARDVAGIDESRLLILNGGGFEPWADRLGDSLDRSHTEVVIAGAGLGTGDPHVWLSPVLAETIVSRIAQGFERVDGTHGDLYAARARTLDDRLRELDRSYRNGLARCERRDITTSHAAFGYLAAAYQLQQTAIAGLSVDEPSARELARLADFVNGRHLPVIFFERLVSPKLAETLAEETGARTLVLDPLEGMTRDDLSRGRTYFTAMQENLANLQTALACTTSTIQ